MTKSLILIGLLVSIVGLGTGIFIFLASDVVSANTYNLYAIVDNANGLLIDTEVKVAGVKVGRIKKMSLENSKAKLTLEIDQALEIRSDDLLKRTPQGFLGASFLEIEFVGTGRILENGDYIVNVNTVTLADSISGDGERIIGDVAGITRDIQSYLYQSNFFEQLDIIISELAQTVANINLITAGLSKSSDVNATNIQVMLTAISGITNALEQFIVNDTSTNSQEMSVTLFALRESLKNIQQISENIDNISNTIAAGEGTLGKLLKDDSLYKEANLAITNINKVTNRAVGLYTDFEYRYEGLVSAADSSFASRNNINLRIAPKDSPRYYKIGLVTGGAENLNASSQYTSTLGGSGIKLNLMLAQSFYPWLTLYGGLIENTGGAGITITPIPQLELGAEAFDFGGGKTGAMTRASAYIYPFFDPTETYKPFKWLYFGGGVDDLLDSYSRNYYFGIGIRIQDEFIYDTVRLIPLISSASTISN